MKSIEDLDVEIHLLENELKKKKALKMFALVHEGSLEEAEALFNVFDGMTPINTFTSLKGPK